MPRPVGQRSDRQLGPYCVGGRSQVLPTVLPPRSSSLRRAPFPYSPSGVQSTSIVLRLPRLRISLARNTAHSRPRIYYYFMLDCKRRRKREEANVCARLYPDRAQECLLCAGTAYCVPHRNFSTRTRNGIMRNRIVLHRDYQKMISLVI